MQKYFVLTESIDLKEIGPTYPQCQDFLKGYKNDKKNKESLYYFSEFKGEKINFVPDLGKFKISEKTKMTDILSCPLGPGNDLVISLSFFEILKKFKKSNVQFFDCLFHKRNNSFLYKWVHFIYDLEKNISFENTIFSHPDEKLARYIRNIKSYADLIQYYKEYDIYENLRADRVILKCDPLDFFTIGRVNQKCYISEKLKNEFLSSDLKGFVLNEVEDVFFLP